MLAALALLPLGAGATNGYFSHGYSVAQKALGGAGTALAEDAMIVTINPAGMFWAGDATELSLSLFHPIRDYIATERGEDAQGGIVTISPSQRRSQNEYYPIPGISYNRRLGDWASWGLSMYGNGGLNTEYIGNTTRFAEGFGPLATECLGTFGGGMPVAGASDNAGFCGNASNRASVDMAQAFVAPSFALRLGTKSSVGLAAIVAVNRFAAQGLAAFRQFSNHPDKVSDNGHELSYGFGFRLGVLSNLIPGLGLGASYQPRIHMSEFDDYAGLFAEQGDFDIPETWNAGVSLRLSGRQRLLIDYQAIAFNQVASVGRPLDPNRFVNDCAIPRLFGDSSDSPACLGADTGPGFGWRDVEVLKFGYQIALDRLRLRLGFSQAARQPIPASEHLFNILAPAVPEQHYTAGLEYRWSDHLHVSLALMYAASNPIRGKNPLSNTDANVLELLGSGAGLGALSDTSEAFGIDEDDQDIILNMRQYELSVGFAWRY